MVGLALQLVIHNKVQNDLFQGIEYFYKESVYNM